MSETAISLQSVSKSYKTRSGAEVPALNNISFDIGEGEFISMVGPSGCGKTTLLKIVGGLIPPSAGNVLVHQKQVRGPISNVGFVFQNSLLMPWRNVLDNVLLPIELLHKDKKDYVKRAFELLDLVGLKNFERAYPRELSGGMQQRVAISRALVHDPSLLLMDEPFGALDEITREQMGVELLKITGQMRKTVVFVTHSIPEAVLLGERVAVLGHRPAVVKASLDIDLPSPRGGHTRANSKYTDYCQKVREILGV